MELHVIVSTYMLEREDYDTSYYNSWETTCKNLGIDFSVVDCSPSKTSNEDFLNQLPLCCKVRLGIIPVFFGTIEFCRKVKEVIGDLPHLIFFDEEKLDCSNYYYKFSKDLPLLNKQCLMLLYKDLLDNWSKVFDYFNENILFMRPNSNMKTFVGGNYLKDNTNGKELFKNTNNLIDDNCLCVVAKSEKIISEYRFFIFNKKVITGSQYNRDLALDIREDVLIEAQQLAEKVANDNYQPDLAYTCDIAELEDNTFKVIEINCGSSSGLYAMNKEKILLTILDYIK